MEGRLIWCESDLPQGAEIVTERRVIRAGEYYPPHWHDYFELELVLSGTGEQGYNRRKYRLSPGCATLMSYYDFHDFRAESDMVLLKVQFTERALPGELCLALLQSHNRFCFSLGDSEREKAAALWGQIREEAPARDAFSAIVAKGALALLAVLFLRKAAGALPLSVQPKPLQKVVAAVHSRFREPLNLTRLAGECAVTPNYLGALFSQHMGASFSEYLNTVRLRHACDLLSGTDLSVKEIGFACGYSTAEYFQAVFRKKLSLTPLTYRKNTKEK